MYGQERADPSDDWEIHFKPYLYMLSLDAKGTVSGLSGSLDIGFDDVVDHLDMAAMGRIEAWKGRWGLTFDGLFMNLSADESFKGRRGIVNFDLDADVRLGVADFAVAYRLVESRFGDEDKQCLTFEPYGGLRYGYLRQKMDLNVNIAGVGSTGASLGGSEDWVEPFIGGHIIWDLSDKLALDFRGDAGGFGIGSASNLMWQIALSIDYKLSKNTFVNAGYRIIDLDYSRGSGSNEFGIDLRAKGPFVGLTVLF
jgi:hypothetical protein